MSNGVAALDRLYLLALVAILGNGGTVKEVTVYVELSHYLRPNTNKIARVVKAPAA